MVYLLSACGESGVTQHFLAVLAVLSLWAAVMATKQLMRMASSNSERRAPKRGSKQMTGDRPKSHATFPVIPEDVCVDHDCVNRVSMARRTSRVRVTQF